MDSKTFNETIDRIRENIGSELSAANSEDLLGVVGAFSELSENYSDSQKQIEKLQAEKEELLKTNGKLFQKIGFDNKVTYNDNNNTGNEKEEDIINLEDIINEKGEII